MAVMPSEKYPARKIFIGATAEPTIFDVEALSPHSTESRQSLLLKHRISSKRGKGNTNDSKVEEILETSIKQKEEAKPRQRTVQE